MPRIVDSRERTGLVVEAFIRVVRREGLRAASVRTVAREAGLTPGAMRHYVDSQSALAELVLRSISERIQQRMAAREPRTVEDVAALVEEVMPLDDERLAELEVWLELATAARTDPTLAPLSRRMHDDLARLFHGLAAAVSPDGSGAAGPGLHALVDGLSLHLALYPGKPSVRAARRLVREELQRIATAPAAHG